MKMLIVLSMLVASVQAFAFPEAPFNALETPIENVQLDNQYDFEGIIKLSNCSGSLIKFAGQPMSTKAYVMTNGHCLGRPFLKPGQVVTNKEVNRRMRVADKNKKFWPVTATKLVYGTMTGTDSAIYELKETYAEILKKYQVRPLDFDNNRPLLGVNIQIISGYWERGYQCFIDGFVYQLLEADWTFTDSIRYSNKGCETIGGTSGSPIIEQGTRTQVGINNTGNESGKRCEMNNPCEVDEDGNVTVRKKASYGQQTYHFTTCLTPDFNLDLTIAGCDLPKNKN
jgi:V8-like Glu-specific endopeptidase